MEVRILPGAIPDFVVMHQHESTNRTDLEQCAATLKRLAQSPEDCLGAKSLEKDVAEAAALLLRRIKAAQKREARQRDQHVVARAPIRTKRTQKEYGRYLDSDTDESDRPPKTLNRRRFCYVCKQPYQQLHSFYDALCLDCGHKHYSKRVQTADLSGRTFVVTGGRIKIGFQIALQLLCAGAAVLATSRFPNDAAYRYSMESDSDDWIGRLRIHSADFRSLPSVERMCAAIALDSPSIDGLINNAAQTVRRPPQYFRHLIEREAELKRTLPEPASRTVAAAYQGRLAKSGDASLVTTSDTIASPALMTQIPMLASDALLDSDAFPSGEYDADGQQIDARNSNSWTMPLSSVSVAELLEVHAVNSLVPFRLIQQLEPLLLASSRPDRYIVNVSAMEGQLNTHLKSRRHPHTNMAKAGMNMLTRTCAEDFATRGIYINSVDTGWVTNEFPLARTAEMRDEGFEPPLDEIDGAARVLDPVFQGAAHGNYLFGKFLKDYREVPW